MDQDQDQEGDLMGLQPEELEAIEVLRLSSVNNDYKDFYFYI